MKYALFLLGFVIAFNSFAQVTVADVSVNVSAMLNPAQDTLTLTATAYLPPNPFQCGDDDARDTRLILSLPPESTIISPRPAGCSVRSHSSTGDPSFVACYLGNMHAGATGATIDIVVKTDYKGLPNVGPYGCSAFVVSETPDCNRDNNFAAISIGVPAPKLSSADAAGTVEQVFPNPTKGLLKVEVNATAADYRVDILSTSGKLVSKNEFVNRSEGLQTLVVETSDLPEGIYFCSVYENQRLINTQKISVVK